MKRELCFALALIFGAFVTPFSRAKDDKTDSKPVGVGRVATGLYLESDQDGMADPSLGVAIDEVTPNIVVLRGANGWVTFASYDEDKKEYRGFFEWKQFGPLRSPGGKWADLYQVRLVTQEKGQFYMTGKSKANDFIIHGKLKP